MPGTSLFDKVGSLLDDAGVTGALGDAVGKLGAGSSSVTDLVSHPPSEIGQMVAGLDGLGLPQVGGLQDAVSAMTNVAGLVPSDGAGLTTGITGALEGLLGPVTSDLVEPVERALRGVEGLAALLPSLGVTPPPHAVPMPRRGRRSRPAGGARSRSTAKPAPAAAGGPLGSLGGIVATLQQVPSPLTLDALLTAALAILREVPTVLFPSGVVPGIGAFREALETVMAWRAMDAAHLAAALADGVEQVAGYLTRQVGGPAADAATELEALAGALQPDPLTAPARAVVTALSALAADIRGGDLSGAGAHITAATDSLGQVRTALTALEDTVAGDAGAAAAARLEALPRELERRLLRAVADLGGPDPPAAAPAPPAPHAADDVAAAAAAFGAAVAAQLQRISSILASIDLSAVQQPLQQVVDTAKGAVQEVDTAIVELTTTVSGLFDQLDTAIDSVDVASLTGTITDALQGIPDQVTGQVQALFDPVKNALSQGIGAIDSAVSAIDFQGVKDTLDTALQSLSDLAGSSDVGAALDEVKSALQEGVDALQNLSFSPVTDAVISEIDDVAQKLASIDLSAIPEPVRGALKAALDILPEDFSHIADPLKSKFDELMQAGPLHVLEPVKDAPDRLKAELAKVTPSSLVGDQLSGPFEALVHGLEGFKPSDALKPVTEALDSVKERLQGLHPSALLAPLSDAFAQVTAGLDELDPAALVKPVTDAIGSAIDGLAAKIPVDAVFGPIDGVLDGIHRVVDAVGSARDAVEGVHRVLEALGSPQDEVTALVDALVGQVGTIADTSAIEPAVASLRTAVEGLRGPAIAALIDGPLGQLADGLAAIDPAALQAALAKARRDFPEDALKALPASPERDQVVALIDGFDPMDPAFARPFTALKEIRERVAQARAALPAFFTQWEQRFMGDHGPLAGFLVDHVTPSTLQDLVRPGVERLVAGPLAGALEVAGRLQAVAGGLVDALAAFLTDVQGRLATLTALPDALHAIQDAMNDLLSSLRALNPTFLVTSVQDAFDHVKQKVHELDPAAVAAAADAAFQQVIDGISVDALLPTDDIKKLDDDYAKILDAVRALDPKELATALDPAFADAIKPIDDILDELSKLITAVTDRLDALGGELTSELDRCAEAFGQMLQAIPL
jgi:hypothetical protein